MSALLTVEQLSVEYVARGGWTPGVQNFSLSLETGEAVGLVGPSGCGKSTVALSILRLIRPQEGRITSGRILFKGRNLLDIPEEAMRSIRGRDIAMIFQDPFTALNPVLRIRTQLEEVLRAHELPVDAAVLEKSLQDVQLEPTRVLASYPHQLSGGQRQRVMIAMALLCKPQLLLADEPTTSLDVLVQKEILDLIVKIRQETRLTLLLITHQQALLRKYGLRAVEI